MFKSWVQPAFAGCAKLSPRELQVLGRIHRDREIYEIMKPPAKPVLRASIRPDVRLQAILGGLAKNLQAVALIGTPFPVSAEHRAGRRPLPVVDKGHWDLTDTAYAMYREAIAYLEENGYRHYEISNFALPGRESCTIGCTGAMKNIWLEQVQRFPGEYATEILPILMPTSNGSRGANYRLLKRK